MEHRDYFVTALRSLLEEGRVVLKTPLVPTALELRRPKAC